MTTKRRNLDTAALHISTKEFQPCHEAILQLKETKWSLAYSKRRGILLIRRRASRRRSEKAAQELEAALAKVAPELPKRLVWACSDGGEERYFTTGEIFVLFDEKTSQVERKRILRAIKGIKIQTYPDIEVKSPAKGAERRPPKGYPLPGFSRVKAKEALATLREAQKKVPVKLSPERPTKLYVPMAKITVPDSQRDEIFEIAAQVAALPGVRAATPDFDVLGINVKGEPQQGTIPPTLPNSVHERQLVDIAWSLVDPTDLSTPADQFLASREQVAVLDWRFLDHPDITYDLKGYDAADQDRDPRTPDNGGLPPHGLYMSGVIGGVGHGVHNEIGIAPGAVIVPVRPSWSTDEDFIEVDGQEYFRDYEEFVERFTANWVDAINRLWVLSHSGLEVANMSIALLNREVWRDSGVVSWMNWWLHTGAWGNGVFATASAGNDPDSTSIAVPANVGRVFAVGWGNLGNGTMLGNSGPGLDIVTTEGVWPEYREDGTIEERWQGGSSVASAIVAGTAAIMKSINHLLTADEIKTILRLTTRKAPGQAAVEDENGYSTQFGWGFLNACYAIDVVWRDKQPAAELLRVKYYAGQPARAMIQIRQRPRSPYAGKRAGMFWALTSQGSNTEQRWIHDRNPQLRHIDQAIDVWGLPFGEFTLVGDFDGDGLDEMALQYDANAFWPSFTDDPAHSFLVYKYDTTTNDWQALGGRSPYASGIASPQVVFPTGRPIHGVVAADLTGDGNQCLVAWQDNVINALHYDAAGDEFLRLNPVDFAPEPLSAAIDQATGRGEIEARRILKAVRIGSVTGQDAILCIGMFTKQKKKVIPLPWPFDDIELPIGPPRHYLTLFVLRYDINAAQWSTVPLSMDSNDTHVLLEETAVPIIEEVLTGDFSPTSNPAYVEVVVHIANDRLHYLSLHRDNANAGFSGYAVYTQELTLPGRTSRLRAGDFGIGGPPTELAWLSDTAHGNEVRFLRWNDVLRVWSDSGVVVSHGRRDNEAIDVTVAEGFNIAGVSGTQDMIALLMKEPDTNVYRTYRWNSATQCFEGIGIL